MDADQRRLVSKKRGDGQGPVAAARAMEEVREIGHEVAGSRSSSCSRKEAREDDAEQPFLEAGDDCSVEAEKIKAGSWLRGTVVDRWG